MECLIMKKILISLFFFVSMLCSPVMANGRLYNEDQILEAQTIVKNAQKKISTAQILKDRGIITSIDRLQEEYDKALQTTFQIKGQIGEFTPLDCAVIAQKKKALLQFLDLGAPIYSEVTKNSALHHAAEQDNQEILEIIIDAAEKQQYHINGYNKQGFIPLHKAISLKFIENINVLYAHGASNLPTKRGNYPTHLAVLSGDEDILKLILAHNMSIDINRFGWQNDLPLGLAIKQKNAHHLVSCLLEHKADVFIIGEGTGISLINLAIEQKNYPALAHMLAYVKLQHDPITTIDTSVENVDSPLAYAIKLKDRAAVQLLLTAGANPNIPSLGCHVLKIAVNHGTEEIIRSLVLNNAQLNTLEDRIKFFDTIRRKIKVGRYTPDLFIFLIEQFKLTPEELTAYPCDFALKLDSPELLNHLLNNGLPLNELIDPGITLLHLAIEYKAKECITLLLNRPDIEVNKTDIKGTPPISHALETELDVDVIRLFQFKGADLTLRNNAGLSANDIAQAKGIKLTHRKKKSRRKKTAANQLAIPASPQSETPEAAPTAPLLELNETVSIAPDNREQEIRSAAITDFVQNDLLASILNRATTIVDEKYTAAKNYIEKFGKHRLVLVDEQKPASPSGSKRSKQTQKIAHFEDNIGGIYHKIRLFNTRGQRALAKSPVFDQEINYIPQIQKRHTLVDQLCEIDPSYVTRHDGTANELPCFSVNMSNGNYRQDLKNLLSDAQHKTIGDKQDLNHLYSLRVDEKVRQFGIVEEFNIDTTKVEVTIPGELSYMDQDGNEQIKLGFFQYGFSPDERCIHRCFRPYDDHTPFITPTLKNAFKIFVESNFNELATDENREQAYEDCIKRLAC